MFTYLVWALGRRPNSYRLTSFRPKLGGKVFCTRSLPNMDLENTDYTQWSNERLIERVMALEKKLLEQKSGYEKSAGEVATDANVTTNTSADRASSPFRKKPKPEKVFNHTQYETRLIALKFAYLGAAYNGFEHHQNNKTPLPTVEEELWKALVKTKMIFPSDTKNVGDWSGAEYSKCGRTDRGVSALGQVIGIRVRSNKPRPKRHISTFEVSSDPGQPQIGETSTEATPTEVESLQPTPKELQDEQLAQETPTWDPIRDEVDYVASLNKVLPPEIRVYAWCPDPPANFSARFSCRERRYKYFFTNPSFSPLDPSNTLSPGQLDIEKMRTAAKMLEGLHDFRNLCKVDPSKQITNFERRIFHADIEEIAPLSTPSFAPEAKLYAFVVHGSAFLWHQVRHLVAIIFLIGQGLEQPSLVQELLDVNSNPRKPMYEMADDKPLVLWDCVFPELSESEEGAKGERITESRPDNINWVYPDIGLKWGRGGLMEDLWRGWRHRKIEEVVAGQVMDVIAQQQNREEFSKGKPRKGKESTQVFEGGNGPKLKGIYVPVMKKEKMATVEDINERYRARRGISMQIAKEEDD